PGGGRGGAGGGGRRRRRPVPPRLRPARVRRRLPRCGDRRHAPRPLLPHPAGALPGAAQTARPPRGVDLAGGDAAVLPAPGHGPGDDRLHRRRRRRAARLDLAAVDDLDDHPAGRGGGGAPGAVVLGGHGRHRAPLSRHPHRLRAGSRGPGGARALGGCIAWRSTSPDGWPSAPAATAASGGPSPSPSPTAAPTSPSSTAGTRTPPPPPSRTSRPSAGGPGPTPPTWGPR